VHLADQAECGSLWLVELDRPTSEIDLAGV
jgi:hypothetical protein